MLFWITTKRAHHKTYIIKVGFSFWGNNLIYCASDGGNIWRGTLNGNDWTSLNDYMQILGITFLRIINTDSGQRLLIGSENNGFYYSDNEGLILNEAEGLDITLNWESIKRTIIKAEMNLKEEEILNIAKNDKLLDKYLNNKSINKVIFVKNKLINILVNE